MPKYNTATSRRVLARRLAYHLERLGKSQAWLTNETGISTSTIHHWLHARGGIRSDQLEYVAHVLGTTTDDLIPPDALKEPSLSPRLELTYEQRLAFNEALRKHVARKFPTVVEFAKAVGVSRVTAYAWLNDGRTPSTENLQQICAALQVEPEDLCVPQVQFSEDAGGYILSSKEGDTRYLTLRLAFSSADEAKHVTKAVWSALPEEIRARLRKL